MSKLYIVIPAYNEEENIDKVAREWHDIVVRRGEESRLIIIDDGSKDDTFDKLKDLQKELPQLEAITKPNSGHGATILYGYNYAVENGADYIFQTDSDGQTIPEEFESFWEIRDQFDAIIGYRKKRKDGFSRVFVTKILKLVIFCIFGSWIMDANTPFRLFHRSVLEKLLPLVPKDYFLTNVLLTVMLEKSKAKVQYLQITFRPRQGGVNSINIKRIFKIGLTALKDFTSLRKVVKKCI